MSRNLHPKDHYDDGEYVGKPWVPHQITTREARKVLCVINEGLIDGMGQPVPGQMCIEAAVNFGLGLPFNDNPPCVSPELRSLKININDADIWEDDDDRAEGLRRIGLIQLGTKNKLSKTALNLATRTAVLKFAVPFAAKYDLGNGNQSNSSPEKVKVLEAIIAFTKKHPGKLLPKSLHKGYDFTDDSLAALVLYINGLFVGKSNFNFHSFIAILEDGHSDLTGSYKMQKEFVHGLIEALVQELKRLKLPGAKFLKLAPIRKRK